MTPPEPGAAFRIIRRTAARPLLPAHIAPPPAPIRLPADADLIRQFDVNVLLVGPHDRCEAVLRAVSPSLRAPIVPWLRPDPLPSGRRGEVHTLLVRHVEDLQSNQQRYLLNWLEDPLAARVVSTASTSLLQQVERGQFCAALYYRLNTICIPLGEHL